jgi:hypothetical protein
MLPNRKPVRRRKRGAIVEAGELMSMQRGRARRVSAKNERASCSELLPTPPITIGGNAR